LLGARIDQNLTAGQRRPANRLGLLDISSPHVFLCCYFTLTAPWCSGIIHVDDENARSLNGPLVNRRSTTPCRRARRLRLIRGRGPGGWPVPVGAPEGHRIKKARVWSGDPCGRTSCSMRSWRPQCAGLASRGTRRGLPEPRSWPTAPSGSTSTVATREPDLALRSRCGRSPSGLLPVGAERPERADAVRGAAWARSAAPRPAACADR
jgi:hypothetical protein